MEANKLNPRGAHRLIPLDPADRAKIGSDLEQLKLHDELQVEISSRSRITSDNSRAELEAGGLQVNPIVNRTRMSSDPGKPPPGSPPVEGVFPQYDRGKRRKSLSKLMIGNSSKHLQDLVAHHQRESVSSMTPEQKLEMLMVTIKKSGHPVTEIFQTFESMKDENHYLTIGQWMDGLKRLNRSAHFPLSEAECQALAAKRFHYVRDGLVHAKLFKDWCYNLRDLSWRAEKQRRSSGCFVPSDHPIPESEPRADVDVPTLDFNAGEEDLDQDLVNEESDEAESSVDCIETPPQEEHQLIATASYGQQIYSGHKLYWRTHDSLEIHIYENEEMGFVTVSTMDAESHEVYPTLRLDSKKIPITKEQIQERAAQKAPSEYKKEAGHLSHRRNTGDVKKSLLGVGLLEKPARQELVVEYLLRRLTMPHPGNPLPDISHLPSLNALGEQPVKRPFIQKLDGDEWDTLLLVAPFKALSPPKRIGRQRTSMTEFNKALNEVESARKELKKHNQSARRATEAIFNSMNVLGDLAKLAAEAEVTSRETNWAKAKWRLGMRRMQTQMQVERVRARLREMPEFKAYMKKLDGKSTPKSAKKKRTEALQDRVVMSSSSSTNIRGVRARQGQKQATIQSHLSPNKSGRRKSLSKGSPSNSSRRSPSNRSRNSLANGSRSRKASEESSTLLPPLGAPNKR